MPDKKSLLLRLDPTLAEELQAVAEVEGRPVSEIVREAIRELVDARRRDRQFQKRLKLSAQRHRHLLERLRDE
jgi:predicted transcriptional regulator